LLHEKNLGVWKGFFGQLKPCPHSQIMPLERLSISREQVKNDLEHKTQQRLVSDPVMKMQTHK
jgi:predicted secreted protein